MKSFFSSQNFQEDDTRIWAINCQQRKEPLFSRKICSGALNRLSPASVDWAGLGRNRAHRVKDWSAIQKQAIFTMEHGVGNANGLSYRGLFVSEFSKRKDYTR
ncbi:hypothetical protein AVEN_101452-1 [Araneus ventricosus]|uniref:Uncharacterized protein n=1 Tax=Araneus ventricosus TaxID=182803 RepID=A0A4Y2CW60_ARAVE|nr:hypothetical protein AVEN_101452-1 [Araneus ventricosus]